MAKNKTTVQPQEGETTFAIAGQQDVKRIREARRRTRTIKLLISVAVAVAVTVAVALSGFTIPAVDPIYLMTGLFFGVMILAVAGQTLVSGRSPHVRYSPEQIGTTFDDVKGLDPVKKEVKQTLDLFLASTTFRQKMGGTPRRGVLFEGPPGTGKTHMAKAMAHEAGVPFLFVSATSFQSMWYGATARKIRSYFKALRKVARTEGGVIGFIEEFDAIGTARGGMSMTARPEPHQHSGMQSCGAVAGMTLNTVQASPATVTNEAGLSEGTGGTINELLVQMQSFDDRTGMERLRSKILDTINLYLPEARRFKHTGNEPLNILLIASTNRASSLDPALLRPGRFDRRFTFNAPGKSGRREIIDFYLDKKAHAPELDAQQVRDDLASITNGYTPVMIENLLDEALVSALQRNDTAMTWADLEHARMATQIGIGQPVEYTEAEERIIATHEAGHATMAWLATPERRLDILTTIKRDNALGLLAHSDREDRYLNHRKEMLAMVQIAMGGQVAEELLIGDITTGPSGDLQYATTVVSQMVGAAGMGKSLVSLSAIQNGSFNSSNLVGQVLGDGASRRELEDILHEAKALTRVILTENIHLVEALRDALLVEKELLGGRIEQVLLEASNGERPNVPTMKVAETKIS